MMVVVFGDEIQMVDQPHRGLQTRVWESSGEKGRVQFIDTLQKRLSGGAKFC